jgi:hypothetical protein
LCRFDPERDLSYIKPAGGDMNKTIAAGALIVLLAAFFSASCVPGPNEAEKTPDAKGNVAGFFMGFWHGLISPITFVISVFSKNVRFYEIHNSGSWYNFGFVIGAGLFLSGGILGKRKSRKS